MAFTNSVFLVQIDPLQLMAVCVKTTPQMTRFREGKVCNNLATDELTITEYSLTTSAKKSGLQKARTTELGTWYCVCVVTMHDNTSDTNDNVTTKIQTDFHTKHMKLYT